MVNWGIIAVGGIAKRRTLPAMEAVENARVIAVMDKNEEVAKNLSREYEIPYVYQNEEELLENAEIDAVYVASPVCFHKEQALKVLRAGKHLLLEKPLGMNQKDGEEIVREAESCGKKAGVAMVMRHHPVHEMMKNLIKEKTIGEIVSCRAQLNCWFPDMQGNWRQNRKMAGGGALVDMGTHCIDLLRYLLEDEVDDSADCLLHMKKGTCCYVDVHFNVPDEAAKGMLEIYGTKGSILAQGTIGQEGKGKVYLNISGEGEEYQSQQIRKSEHMGEELLYNWKNIYASQIQAFSEAIICNGYARTDVKDALETVKVIDALYQSAETGMRIYV